MTTSANTSDRFDEMFECLLYNDMFGFFITN